MRFTLFRKSILKKKKFTNTLQTKYFKNWLSRIYSKIVKNPYLLLYGFLVGICISIVSFLVWDNTGHRYLRKKMEKPNNGEVDLGDRKLGDSDVEFISELLKTNDTNRGFVSEQQ